MTVNVRVLPRAEEDAFAVFDYIARHPRRRVRWWRAFEAAVTTLAVTNPAGYSLAPEDDLTDQTLRQFFFRTKQGRTYRGVFTVVDQAVVVLRIRGPEQAPANPEELRE